MAAAPVVPLLLLRSVRAIDPAEGLDSEVDVVVERGVITRVGRGAITPELASAENAMKVDGSTFGGWVLPAFVDMHAHLREPGEEYKEDIASGLSAAARGGFAHVCA